MQSPNEESEQVMAKGSDSDSPVTRHRRKSSLLQRIEFAEQLVSKFVSEAETEVLKLCGDAWKVCHFDALPKWLQDNDFLRKGHRPPLPDVWICFKSIFRMHTETGNIWTHGVGVMVMAVMAIYMFVLSDNPNKPIDKLMLAIYFCGAITCLLFSTLFHTYCCHSPEVSKLWSKLDYCGISAQITGSMIPAFYYSFYNNLNVYIIYITVGLVLCAFCVTVSLWDKFSEPRYRPLRATLFLSFGLSNVIPGIHWFIILETQLIWSFCLFILQGLLYVIGALLYANRIPERFFPGKCDYWFQSHQIFHILVVLAAIVHLNGIHGMAVMRAMDSALQEVI